MFWRTTQVGWIPAGFCRGGYLVSGKMQMCCISASCRFLNRIALQKGRLTSEFSQASSTQDNAQVTKNFEDPF